MDSPTAYRVTLSIPISEGLDNVRNFVDAVNQTGNVIADSGVIEEVLHGVSIQGGISA